MLTDTYDKLPTHRQDKVKAGLWVTVFIVVLAITFAIPIFASPRTTNTPTTHHAAPVASPPATASFPFNPGDRVTVYFTADAVSGKQFVFTTRMNGGRVALEGELVSINDHWLLLRHRDRTMMGSGSALESDVAINLDHVYATRMFRPRNP